MAGRIRTIKPELLEDERVAALSSDAFRLFVGCILLADDHGNFRLAVGYLSGQVFWRLVETRRMTLDDVERARAELLAPDSQDHGRPGLVLAYRVGGQVYGHVTGWERHQKVEKPGKPRCPGPAASDAIRITIDSAVVQEIRESLAAGSRLSREALSPDLRPPTSDPDPDPDPQDTPAPAGHEPDGSGASDSANGSTLGSAPASASPPVPPGARMPDLPDPDAATHARPAPTAPKQADEPPKPPPEYEAIFAEFVAGWRRAHPTAHRPPKLDEKRRRLIRARLRDFAAADLALAARGIWESRWHVDNGQVEFHIALRDAGQVERFRELALTGAAPSGPDFVDPKGRVRQGHGHVERHFPEIP